MALEMSFAEDNLRECDDGWHGDHQTVAAELRHDISSGQLPQVVDLLQRREQGDYES